MYRAQTAGLIYCSALIYTLIGTKLLLNARLDRLLTVTKPSDKMVQLVCVNHADVPVAGSAAAGAKIGTYLIKTKTSDVRKPSPLCIF